jgi:alanyl-tRNA synthetase
MTDRLYYSDATWLAFDAVVRHLDPSRLQVVLDRSAFYPTSGGQPHDIGVLAGIPVVDVTESDEHVVHHLSAPLAASVGDRVDGVVDAARRFDHMQQHSGQHLLSAVLEDRYGWPTVSVHFGSDSCSLDLRTDAVAAHDLIEAERLVNGHVFENRAITRHLRGCRYGHRAAQAERAGRTAAHRDHRRSRSQCLRRHARLAHG